MSSSIQGVGIHLLLTSICGSAWLVYETRGYIKGSNKCPNKYIMLKKTKCHCYNITF